jgi:hypothetical protein
VVTADEEEGETTGRSQAERGEEDHLDDAASAVPTLGPCDFTAGVTEQGLQVELLVELKTINNAG